LFGNGFDADPLGIVRTIAAILCVGLAITFLDDFMDLRRDTEFGVPSVAVRLGEATLPYTMVLFALAVAFNMKVAVSLFAASYALGMVFDLNRMLPSGLLGWHESAIVLGIAAFASGPTFILWALAIMSFVQCIDDMIDYNHDAMSGNANVVRRFGIGEVRIVTIGLLFAASFISPFYTACVIAGVSCIEYGVWRFVVRGTDSSHSTTIRGANYLP